MRELTGMQSGVVVVAVSLAVSAVVAWATKPSPHPQEAPAGNRFLDTRFLDIPAGCEQAWEGQCLWPKPFQHAVEIELIDRTRKSDKLTAPIGPLQRVEHGPPGEPFTQHPDDDKLPEQLTPAAPEPPKITDKIEPEPPIVRHWHADQIDVCARHRLRRIITHNGKGWRCR